MTKSEIFTAYNILKAAMKKQGDTKAIERLNKALGILQSKAYYMGGKNEYQPTTFDCGCKDWEFRYARKRGYTGPCKHMLAEIMFDMIVTRREAHKVQIERLEKVLA